MSNGPTPTPEGRRDQPRWTRRLLVLVILIAAAALVLAVPICQVYRGA